MTSQVARALERRGLIDRRPDPDDSRARRRLASDGERVLRTARPAVECADLAFLGALDASELTRSSATLH